jgi:hypothetical protein
MIHEWRMRSRLQSFKDGELSPASRIALAQHLTECPACTAAVHRLTEMDHLLLRGCPTPPPLPTAVTHAMWERALAESRRFPGGPGRGWPLLAWGLTAGLVVAATGAAAWWNLGTPPGAPGAGRSGTAPAAVVAARDYRSGEEETLATSYRYLRRPQSPPRRRSPGDSTGEPRSNQEKPTAPRTDPNAPPAVPPGTGSGERPRRPRPPRYRLAQGPTPFRCEPRSAAWWGRLTEEVAASDASAAALRDEIRMSVRLACLPSSQPTIGDQLEVPSVQALQGDQQEVEQPFVQNPVGPAPIVPMEVVPEAVPGGPGLGPVLDLWSPQTSGPGDVVAEAPAPMQLLVMVSEAPDPSGITVTRCPASTPGFARAIALRPDGCGGVTWTQATVTSEGGPKLALVMLGSDAHWWE